MCEMYPNPEGADPKLRAAVKFGGGLSIQYPDVSCCILMYLAKILYLSVF